MRDIISKGWTGPNQRGIKRYTGPNRDLSGQILATSHDRFPPNGGLVREITLFQGNPGW